MSRIGGLKSVAPVRGGRLREVGHGAYKLIRYAPMPYDTYAEAVALVRDGACLSGVSVLAMHDLALVNPSVIEVSVPGRNRRSLPSWVRTVKADGSALAAYEGIPGQSVADAIRACRRIVMHDRLMDAAEDARVRVCWGKGKPVNSGGSLDHDPSRGYEEAGRGHIDSLRGQENHEKPAPTLSRDIALALRDEVPFCVCASHPCRHCIGGFK